MGERCNNATRKQGEAPPFSRQHRLFMAIRPMYKAERVVLEVSSSECEDEHNTEGEESIAKDSAHESDDDTEHDLGADLTIQSDTLHHQAGSPAESQLEVQMCQLSVGECNRPPEALEPLNDEAASGEGACEWVPAPVNLNGKLPMASLGRTWREIGSSPRGVGE